MTNGCFSSSNFQYNIDLFVRIFMLDLGRNFIKQFWVIVYLFSLKVPLRLNRFAKCWLCRNRRRKCLLLLRNSLVPLFRIPGEIVAWWQKYVRNRNDQTRIFEMPLSLLQTNGFRVVNYNIHTTWIFVYPQCCRSARRVDTTTSSVSWYEHFATPCHAAGVAQPQEESAAEPRVQLRH